MGTLFPPVQLFNDQSIHPILMSTEPRQVTQEKLFQLITNSSNASPNELFPVEDLSMDEVRTLSATNKVDVDFLLFSGICKDLIGKKQVADLLGDLSGEFLPRPKSVTVFSKSHPRLYNIARLGDYSIAVPRIVSVADAKDQVDLDNYFGYLEQSDDEDEGTSSTAPTSPLAMAQESIQLALNECHKEVVGRIPFRTLSRALQKYFELAEIVIYRYGQKCENERIPLALYSLVTDAHVPIEIALGIQYHLDGYFMSAKYHRKYRSSCYSNFLSNIACNLYFNDANQCRAYAPNCYRMSVYNTWQHTKSKIKFLFNMQADPQTPTLSEFANSFEGKTGFDEKIKTLGKNLLSTELRIEQYFSISNMAEFDSSFKCIRSQFPHFAIVKKPEDEVVEHFSYRCETMKLLFNYCKHFNDAKVYLFFIYFEKFWNYIFSSSKMSENFFSRNIGAFVEKNFFDQNDGELTLDYFQSFSIPHIWGLNIIIFGDIPSSLLVRGFYFLMFVIYYRSYIENNPTYVGKIAEYLLKVFQAIPFNASSNGKRSNLNVTFDGILQVLLQKYESNPFWHSIFHNINVLSIAYSPLYSEVASLVQMHNIHVLEKGVVYRCTGSVNNELTEPTFQNLVDAVKRYSCEQFTLQSGEIVTNQNRQFIEDFRIVDYFYAKFVNNVSHLKFHFFGAEADKQLGILELNEIKHFYAILFSTVPIFVSGEHTETIHTINVFFNFDQLMKFIFVGLVKFYRSSAKSTTLEQFCYNCIACRDYYKKIKGGLTVNKALAFTGLFDLKGKINCPIVPVLLKKTLIVSRFKPGSTLPVAIKSHLPVFSDNSNVDLSLERTKPAEPKQDVFKAVLGEKNSNYKELIYSRVNDEFEKSGIFSPEIQPSSFDDAFSPPVDAEISPKTPETSKVSTLEYSFEPNKKLKMTPDQYAQMGIVQEIFKKNQTKAVKSVRSKSSWFVKVQKLNLVEESMGKFLLVNLPMWPAVVDLQASQVDLQVSESLREQAKTKINQSYARPARQKIHQFNMRQPKKFKANKFKAEKILINKNQLILGIISKKI